MISETLVLMLAVLNPESFKHTLNDTTWAKFDVSYDQYVNDSIVCAQVGYYRDVSKDKPARRFITGWNAAETALNMPGGNGDSWGAAVARTQPDRRVAELMAIQTNDVHQCLIGKGYKEVTLTPKETKKLRRLTRGSEERRLYLYSIAKR